MRETNCFSVISLALSYELVSSKNDNDIENKSIKFRKLESGFS